VKIRHSIAATIVCILLVGVDARGQEACSLVVRGAGGSTVGRIESDGTIRDVSGRDIGRFKGGTVRNGSGASIGRIDQNGTVRDRSGSTIGKVDDDGDMRNASGSFIGKITPVGAIRNKNGASRGRFDNYVPVCRHVAAAYLFFFEPLHSQ
jgi:hypothetical protein